MALYNVMRGWEIKGIEANQMYVLDFPTWYKIAAIAFNKRLNDRMENNLEHIEIDYREDTQTLVLFNNSDEYTVIALSAFVEVTEEDRKALWCDVYSSEVGELDFEHFWPLIWTDDTVIRHTPYKITETETGREIRWER